MTSDSTDTNHFDTEADTSLAQALEDRLPDNWRIKSFVEPSPPDQHIWGKLVEEHGDYQITLEPHESMTGDEEVQYAWLEHGGRSRQLLTGSDRTSLQAIADKLISVAEDYNADRVLFRQELYARFAATFGDDWAARQKEFDMGTHSIGPLQALEDHAAATGDDLPRSDDGSINASELDPTNHLGKLASSIIEERKSDASGYNAITVDGQVAALVWEFGNGIGRYPWIDPTVDIDSLADLLNNHPLAVKLQVIGVVRESFGPRFADQLREVVAGGEATPIEDTIEKIPSDEVGNWTVKKAAARVGAKLFYEFIPAWVDLQDTEPITSE